ncbi:MAG TPA: T9SS type A sorting domain-containing protein [Candidatus Eisenbacteria bacterium]|nr:T9SS type A sorting domain-containing protein [Candidatus Eisenbacteria bacterium]
MLQRVMAWMAVAAVSLALGAPARAQEWRRVTALPASDVFALRAMGDTLVAGMDTTVFVSTDGGGTWRPPVRVAVDVAVVDAVLLRNGRSYAGTLGQGVFVSDDLGASWQPFNDGLTGGLFDSQLDVADLEARGDSLYAATQGAGVYVRRLTPADTWHPYGDAFEPNQAPNVSDLASDGARLVACAGGNGMMFTRDPADPDWTVSFLDDVGIHAGLAPEAALWTGSSWVVGTNLGVFASPTGLQPWTRTQTPLTQVHGSAFALRGGTLIGAFDLQDLAVIQESVDQGATWSNVETLLQTFVYQLVVQGGNLFAARADGLWVRRATTSVPEARGPGALRVALVGPNPVRDVAQFRFELPRAGEAALELFDVAGRAAARVSGFWSAGVHETSVDAAQLAPGVYGARLTSGGASATTRVVRVL